MTEGRRPRPDGPPRPSPAAPASEVRRLVERLREAKEATGLSFAALAAATAYSKSSWERYLNGKALPPRGAVEALAELSGADSARLLALWRLADSAWSGRDAPSPAAEPGPGVEPGPGAGAKPGPGPDPVTGTGPRTRSGTGPGATGSGAAVPARAVPAPKRRAVAVAVAVTGAVTAAVVGTAAWAWVTVAGRPEEATARTAVPCRGESCTDHDSEQGGTPCWTDATTHAVRTVSGRTVELRHSPTCEAVWGRIRGPRPTDRVWVETVDGRRQSRQVSVPGRSLYTLMVGVDRPADARACYDLGDGASGCTERGR
ncbi:hypothetical protein GCM10019016_099250 [Streptomyces prasinosporus]|uniref:HTH cro/C1-type domain-containing protein n=1 Tax=Streptomyces prasinosporus TaxID=68256 RepID=A0ABP6U8L6_9ACTN